ncbi:hypothetical protein T492DRAFT_1089760 [Pavlovales sp. CCMP2436]|nr:hypothetical protein T492DRAFT_1089760 [Pavlovales sp. CCMP2436]
MSACLCLAVTVLAAARKPGGGSSSSVYRPLSISPVRSSQGGRQQVSNSPLAGSNSLLALEAAVGRVRVAGDAALERTRGLPFIYGQLAQSHPLPVAATQAASLRIVGDRISQGIALYRGEIAGIDLQHMLAMGIVAFFASGAGGSMWLNHLERALGETEGPADVLKKCGCDFVFWAPIANCAYLAGVPMLTGADLGMAITNAQEHFLPTMAIELSIFGPYNVLSFSAIPLHLRPITGSLCSLMFTLAIASKC